MPSITLPGTSGSGSGPEVVARSGDDFSLASRLKYTAGIRLLAEPCRQTSATLRSVMCAPVFFSQFARRGPAAGLPLPRQRVGAHRRGDILDADAAAIEQRDVLRGGTARLAARNQI